MQGASEESAIIEPEEVNHAACFWQLIDDWPLESAFETTVQMELELIEELRTAGYIFTGGH